MVDNTFVLFEEIKKQLENIGKELQEIKQKSSAPSIQTSGLDEIQVQELLKVYEKQTKDLLNKFGVQVRIKEEEGKNIHQLIACNIKLVEEIKSYQGKQTSTTQEVIHKHSFDIKSSKVSSGMILLGLISSLSLLANFMLWSSKRQYEDDALKFRVIRVWKGCNSKEILWLNEVFDIHRNETAIKNIKKEIDGYDLRLKHKVDSLMQTKLHE
ncbi:hypothetical protein [Segatella oris]|uniref:Uncharacterized protein n=1 Tax=Segatella oris TaxID=28135 RepID=A0A448L273_9BACT|nr:hypothetical protein [Segatella oris]VEH14114.1 Uncharacterised protein [Segatella oris]